MMGGITVFLDILALLPDTEVVKRGGGVEAHCGSFLLYVKHRRVCDHKSDKCATVCD